MKVRFADNKCSYFCGTNSLDKTDSKNDSDDWNK